MTGPAPSPQAIGPRVLLDACVLYPTVMREVLLAVAEEGMFRPLWSPRILEEWARAVARSGAAHEAVARGEIALLAARFPHASLRVPEGLAARLWLPDPSDVHVLAAAVTGSADAVLTLNAKDFPRDILADEGLVRCDPDTFLRDLWGRTPAPVEAAIGRVVAEARRLSGQDWTATSLLKKARLPRIAKAMRDTL